MLYTVAIAICLSTTPASDCAEKTAVVWMQAPEDQPTAGACMMHGMFYAASSNLVTPGSYARVFCTPGGSGTARLLLRNE
jgi:hypothetical protein